MTAQYPKRKAFTLIELLVVVAIIAVLISLLLPALGEARDLAKGVVCQSNERAIGLTMVMYRESWKNWMPPLEDTSSNAEESHFGEGDATWYWADTLIDDFDMKRESFSCPIFPPERGAKLPTVGWTTSDNVADYGLAGTLFDNNGNLYASAKKANGNSEVFPQYGAWPFKLITRPQEGMLASDSVSWAGTNIRPWMGDPAKIPHGGRQQVNVLFYYAHVEAWDCYARPLYDNPPYAAAFGEANYSIFSGPNWSPSWTPNGAGPSPVWRPWEPYWDG